MRTELLLATLILGIAACGDPPAAGGSAAPSGSQAKPPASAAKTATATAAVKSAAPTATASAAPDMKAIVGTCNHKGDAICKEYLGKLPDGVEEACAGKDKKGELAKGSTPCAPENAIGKCEAKVGDLEEVHHYYKKAGATEASVKKACEDAKGTFSAAGAATPAASGAASATPAASAKK